MVRKVGLSGNGGLSAPSQGVTFSVQSDEKSPKIP